MMVVVRGLPVCPHTVAYGHERSRIQLTLNMGNLQELFGTPATAAQLRLAREWEKSCLHAFGIDITETTSLGVWYTKPVWYRETGGTTKIRLWPKVLEDLKMPLGSAPRMEFRKKTK